MAEFKIFFKKSVEKDLKGIPGNYLAKILKKIELLKENLSILFKILSSQSGL